MTNNKNNVKLNASIMRKGGVNIQPNIPRPSQPPKPQGPKIPPPKK